MISSEALESLPLRRARTLALCILVLCLVGLFSAGSARAQFNASVPPYDLADLGVPKFINTNFIDVQKVTQLSKFRSDAGHDYSDETEFGSQALIDTITNKPEFCRSMKHYFFGPDGGTAIYAPVAGTITGVDANSTPDVQIGIQSDALPAFGINIFHVMLAAPLTVGQHVAEGQLLGYFPDPAIYPYISEDIAIFVMSTQGFHLVSYFDVLTDAALAPFLARGLTSADAIVYTAAQRDAAPYQCTQGGEPPLFINVTSDPSLDYFPLTGGAATQSLTLSAVPSLIHTSDVPRLLTATASSGLAVTISSLTPRVCTVSGSGLNGVAAGQCELLFVQPGNANLFETSQARYLMVIAGLNAGPLYSSARADLQSFVRFYNSSTAAGTVTAELYNASNGVALGQWTSPSIPAGAELQFPIATLESVFSPGIPLPQSYSLLVQAGFTGTFQHVLWRPNEGVLTDLTTCAFGTGSDPANLSGVHSSLMNAAGYASTVVVTNGGTAAAVALDIFDARNGAKLGTYTTATIPANGQMAIPVTAMEAAAKITPTAGMVHYVIKAESPFGGFLQHLIDNLQPGVTTDMTAQCTLDSSTPAAAASTQVQTGLVYSSLNSTVQSYVRFWNAGYGNPATVSVTLNDPATGKALGTWTSPNIPRGAAEQYAIATLESALPANTPKPASYSLSIQSTFIGYFQHVAWNPTSGAFTNLTSCSNGLTANSYAEPFVHSALLTAYPSTLMINNFGLAPGGWSLTYWNAATATDVADIYSTALLYGLTIAGNASVDINVASSETSNFTFPAGLTYFIATVGDSVGIVDYVQPAYIQHLVTSTQSGVVENMSTLCPLY